jgi:hypothetical protein
MLDSQPSGRKQKNSPLLNIPLISSGDLALSSALRKHFVFREDSAINEASFTARLNEDRILKTGLLDLSSQRVRRQAASSKIEVER